MISLPVLYDLIFAKTIDTDQTGIYPGCMGTGLGNTFKVYALAIHYVPD